MDRPQIQRALEFADRAQTIADVSCIDGLDALRVLAAHYRLARKEVNDTIREYEKECRDAFRQGQQDECFRSDERGDF